MRSPRAALGALRRDPRQRRAATVGAVLVGLGLGSVHWVGLVCGGVLVGLCQPSLRRATVAGLGFGAVVVGVFLARLALAGTLATALGMGALPVIAVATPLVAGPLGGALGGLTPAKE